VAEISELVKTAAGLQGWAKLICPAKRKTGAIAIKTPIGFQQANLKIRILCENFIEK
jgi:hypothetical protein